MKNRKTAKLLTLVLSCILIIGAMMGITALADETVNDQTENPGVDTGVEGNVPENTVAIKYKNVSYAEEMKLVYYVKAENALLDGQSVKVLYWEEEGETPVTLESQATLTVEGVKHEAFFSAGFGPVDMRKTVYAQPVIANADGTVAVYGEVLEYSLYEYAMAVFSKASTADQQKLLTRLLDYGATVQQVMYDEGLYPELPEVGYADEYYIYEYEIYGKTEVQVEVEPENGGVVATTTTEETLPGDDTQTGGETAGDEESEKVYTTKDVWVNTGKTVRIALRAGQIKSYQFDGVMDIDGTSYVFEGFGSVDADGNAIFDNVFTAAIAEGDAEGLKLNTAFANRTVELSATTLGVTKLTALYRPTTATMFDFEDEQGVNPFSVPKGEATTLTGTLYYYNYGTDKVLWITHFYKDADGNYGAYVDKTNNKAFTDTASKVTDAYTFIPLDELTEKEHHIYNSGYYDFVSSPTDEDDKVFAVVKHFYIQEMGKTFIWTNALTPAAYDSSKGYAINIGFTDKKSGPTVGVINTSEQPTVSTKYVLDTDFCYGGAYSHTTPSQYFFNNANGDKFWGLSVFSTTAGLSIGCYDANKAWKNNFKIYNVAGEDITSASRYITGLSWNTWYNLRIEYEIFPDSNGTRRISFYLDGVLQSYVIGNSESPMYDDTNLAQATFFHLNASRNTYLYLNNTYLETIGTNEEIEAPEEEEVLTIISGNKYYYESGESTPKYQATFTPDAKDETKGTLVLVDNSGETSVTTTYTYVIGSGSVYTFYKDDTVTTEIALTFGEAGEEMLKVGDADAVQLGAAKEFGDDYPTYKGETGKGDYAALSDGMDGAKPSINTVEGNIIPETVGDAVNNVLKLNMHEGKSEGGSALYNTNIDTSKTFVADFDFKFVNSTLDPTDIGKDWVFKFALNNAAGTEITMPAIYPVDEYWQIKVGSTAVKFDSAGHTKLSRNEWYNIRIEYTYESGAEKDNLKVFINGFEGYSGAPGKNSADVSKFYFNIRSGGGYTTSKNGIYDTEVLIDNVYIGTPIADNIGNGAHVDNELTNDYTDTEAGTTDLTVKDTKNTVNATKTSADIYTYETDFIWTGENGSFELNLLASQTEGTASIASLFATVNNGAITFSTSKDGAAVAVVLAGKWANIRVEYTPASKTVAGETEGTVTEYSGKYTVYINNNKVATATSAAETTVVNTAFAGAELTVVGELKLDNTFCNAEFIDVIGSGAYADEDETDKYVTGEGDAAVDGYLSVTDTYTFVTNANLGDKYFFETDFRWLGESGSIVIVDKDGAALVTVTVTVADGAATLTVGEQALATVPVGYWRNLSVAYAEGKFTVTVGEGVVTVAKEAASFGGAVLNGNADADNTYVVATYSNYQGKGENASSAIKYNKNGVFTTNDEDAIDANKENPDVLTWIDAAQKELVFGKKYGTLAIDFANSKTGTTYIFETDLSFAASGLSDKADSNYFTITMESEKGDLFTVYAIGVYKLDAASGCNYLALSTSKSVDDAFAYVRADLWYNLQITYTVVASETEGAYAGEWTVALNGAQVATGTVESDVDNTTYVSAEMELSADVYAVELTLQKTYIGATTVAAEE